MREKTKNMLGVYLLFQYLFGAGVAMVFFGWDKNPPLIGVILALGVLFLGGLLSTVLIANLIIRGCEE